MPSRNLHSSTEVQSLILKLAVSLESEYTLTPESKEANGQAALALALAYGVSDPDVLVNLDYKGEIVKPLLHASLYVRAGQERAENWPDGAPLVNVSLNPSDDWPPESQDLPARERLALLLVRNGADPWVKDDARMDALDWAVQAGSRSMVSLLLRHPECPPLKELQKRTLHLSGKRPPWLHFLAGTGRSDLFIDLVNHGLDPVRLDNQGWPAVAWAGNPDTLRAILPTQPKEVLEKNQELILEAWGQRAAKSQGSSIRYEDMVAVFSESVVMDKAMLEEAELGKLAEKFLAARASTYYPASLSFTPHASSNPKQAAEHLSWLYERMEERFDWRIEKKSGVSRGRWSMISAAMWAVFFGESGSSSSREFLANGVEAILSRKDEKERDRWLEEEIRPGLTNQGLASLILFGDRAPQSKDGSDLPFLFGRFQGPGGSQAMLDATLRAAVSLIEGQSSKTAKEEISASVAKYLARMERAQLSLKGALPLLPSLVGKGVFRPHSAQYSTLATLAINGLIRATDSQDKKVALESAMGLVSLPSHMLHGLTQGNKVMNRSRMLQNRDRLVKAILGTLKDFPELAMDVDARSYPFAAENLIATTSGNKDPNRHLPSPAEWSVTIQQLQMEGQLPEASEAPSHPSARPGRRF